MLKLVTVWGNATSVAERRPENYARDITLRYPVKCAFGGNAVRLHFSNFCGTEPITLTQVAIASAVSDREINLKDAALITFAGKESVTINAGEEIVSDEIPFRIKPKDSVSVSFYLEKFYADAFGGGCNGTSVERVFLARQPHVQRSIAA